MPIETNLNVQPYYDDTDERKDFYRVLFKPGVSVQTRELNQLQALLQIQVERFGDNIFKRGTIIDGCNFVFHESYPYVKLMDLEDDGTPLVTASLPGFFARNDQGVRAFIQSYVDGFEAADPDMKTAYVSYVNSGDDGNTFSFSPGDLLTVYDSQDSIHKVRIDVPGVGFSNSDKIVVTPAVVVNVSSGTFTNGEYVTQDSLGSNLQIVWIDDVSLALQGQVILGLAPRTVDLANASVNVFSWAVSNGESVRDSTNSAAGTIEAVLGAGASGDVVTDASGRIRRVDLTDPGSGYSNVPYVSVRSANNAAGISAARLTALNYKARVLVANTADAVGEGYAFGVTEGVIYQKGYFLRVEPHTVVVSKYDQNPNNVVVGFDSDEEIIDANRDPSLNDPAATGNQNAPGADRLKITPRLAVVGKDALDPESDFYPIVEWSEGQPAKTNQVTDYSKIGDEMRRRTFEAEGDFVLDQFQVTTRSPTNPDLEGTRVDVVVDPGLAYVSGHRIETQRNYVVTIDKGVDSLISNTQVVPLAYGSYVRVNQYAGSFMFSTGDLVQLRSSPAQYLSASYGSAISAPGTQVGTARVRSVVYESGVPGTPSAVYRAYLFDVRMDPGRSFRQVRSIFYDGTHKGVADVVLELDPTTSQQVAVLRESSSSQLLFSAGVESLKNANSATYVYRTVNQEVELANTGVLTESLVSRPNEFFRWVGDLTDDEMQDLTAVPLQSVRSSSALSGTVATDSSSANVTGSGTDFISTLASGDYVYVSGNSTENVVRRVQTVVNNTVLVLSSNVPFTNAAAAVRRAFPAGAPIPLGRRDGLSANVSANASILTVDLGMSLNAAANVSLSYDVERTDVDPAVKTASRDRYVKISLANNAGGVSGPWCLGIPDVFRLKGVWLGTTSSVSESSLEVTDDFLVDPNQTPDYLGTSWVYRRPDSGLVLTSSDWLLVKFDHFNAPASGFYCTPSYVGSNSDHVAVVDSTPLADLGSDVSTYEIPRVLARSGGALDLLNHFDFRPIAANTVPSTNAAASAPVNPSSAIGFGDTSDPANDKKFPLPGGRMVLDVEQYLGRRDSVVVGIDGNIAVLRGTPAPTPSKRFTPVKPMDTMVLNTVDVPAYPTLPVNPSPALAEVLNTRRFTETTDAGRYASMTARAAIQGTNLDRAQPMRKTQADIGSLQRRVENLEYYASLSLLESAVKDKVIPSSVDPSIDRFKFGFMVDDFSDDRFLDVDNPRHSASIEDGKLVPAKTSWNVEQSSGSLQTPAFIEHLVIQQTYATKGPVVVTPPTQPNTPSQPVVANTIMLKQSDYTTKSSTKSNRAYISIEVVDMSKNGPGQVEMFFSNDIPGAGNENGWIDVYRGSAKIRTDQNHVALSGAEKTLIQGNTFQQWFRGAGLDMKSSTSNGFKGGGKLTWTHNPALGSTYTIVVSGEGRSLVGGVEDGGTLTPWKYALRFPVDASVLPSGQVQPGPFPPSYAGVMRVEPTTSSVSRSPGSLIVNLSFPSTFKISCWGLKPNTLHQFYVEGVPYDPSRHGKLINFAAGSQSGTSVRTDASGRAEFTIATNIKVNIASGSVSFNVAASGSRAAGKYTRDRLNDVLNSVSTTSATFIR